MRRYKKKTFVGLIRYGQARFNSIHNHWKILRNPANKGCYSLRDIMESHAIQQRKFNKRRV